MALEVVSHCPGLQGSSTELLRNNVGLGLRAMGLPVFDFWESP
jgi:hypothetical protein